MKLAQAYVAQVTAEVRRRENIAKAQSKAQAELDEIRQRLSRTRQRLPDGSDSPEPPAALDEAQARIDTAGDVLQTDNDSAFANIIASASRAVDEASSIVDGEIARIEGLQRLRRGKVKAYRHRVRSEPAKGLHL